MEIVLLILALIILAVLVLLYLKMSKPAEVQDNADLQQSMHNYIESLRSDLRESGGANRKEIGDRIDHITKLLNDQQAKSSDQIQSQMRETGRIIEDVKLKLKDLESTNKQVLGFTEQLKSLENILRNPKQRGMVGEYLLENLLSNILPPDAFKMKYVFKNNTAVDAAVFAKDQIIPVDAKFSVDNYNRLMEENDPKERDRLESNFKSDLKKRIDETSKYILPEEGTTDFALMFIPADGIFYTLLSQKVGTLEVNAVNLVTYALDKKVILVSPMTFYAYLQTILHSIRTVELENNARFLIKRVGVLDKHLKAYEEHLGKLGNQIGTVVNTYNASNKEFKKIDKDVYKITDKELGGEFEPEFLDKPQMDTY